MQKMKPIKTTRVKPNYLLMDNEVSTKELQKRLDGMKRFEFWGVEDDCRRFANAMIMWRDEALYKHFSETWDDFVSEHIQKPQIWIEHIIHGVSILDGSANAPTPQVKWEANATPEQIAKAISKEVPPELMAEVVKHLL
jgi:hypothetical protein